MNKMNKKFTKLIAAAMLLLLITPPLRVWGQTKTETTTTYTWTTRNWDDSTNSWDNDKGGYQYNGTGTTNVQVTSNSNYTGAGATSKNEFTNITSITVNAATTTSGVGNITVKVGSGSAQTICNLNKQKTFSNYTLEFDSPVSGKVTFVVNCTTNSMYMHSISVTTSENSDPTQLSTPTNFAATPGNAQATFTWDAVEHASSYTISYTPAGDDEATVTGITGTSRTITGLSNDTEYTCKIKAVGDGEDYSDSEYSSTITVTPINATFYNVNIASSITGGTVEASTATATAGTTITLTAMPSAGYTFNNIASNWTVSPAVTITPGANNTATFEMPASDVTVSATFTAMPVYSVSCTTPANGTLSVSPTSGYNGVEVTITATPNSGYELATLTATDSEGEITITDNKFNIRNSNVTVTATFTAAIVYEWVSVALSNLKPEDIFVIVGNNGSNYAMTNDNGTSNPPVASAVTITNGKLTSTVADNIKWNISGNSTDGYTFYPNGSTTTWLYCTNTNNGVRVGTNDNKSFKLNNGYLKNDGTSRYVGIYSSQDWRCYTSNSGNIENQTFAFYKRAIHSSVATPTFSVPTGTYNENLSVTITCATDGATIYYTTDGTDPTTESTEYTAAIPVATTTTIKAIAVKAGMANSEIATVTYTISIPAITLNSYSIEAPEAGDSGILEATYHNITDVAAEVWFCNAEGTEEAEYSWISASINDDNDIAYTINSNNGDARTAYFKVYALDDDSNDVYSNLVTVTQAGATPKYNVLFVVNGGTFIGNEDFPTDAEEKEAGTYTLPSATKEDFTFAGWLLDGTETIYASGEHYEVTTDALFTAQWTNAVTATINFTTGTGNTPISNASVTGEDDANNTWNVITTGSNVYFSTGNSNSQVGSTSRPATSITFTMSLATPATFTTFNAKFGGSANASRGTITIKVGERVIGTGNIYGTTPVTVTNNVTDAIDKDITVIVDEITSGILCYYFNYTYEINTDPIINPTVDPLAYDATSGTITYEIDNYVAGSMTASTEADWISNFEYEPADEIGTVGFTTTANASHESREATITLTFTYDNDKTVTKDVTVTQGAAPCIVYFAVGDDGTFVPNEDFDDEMVEVEAGTYTLPSATKEGYAFNGWSDGEQTYAAGTSYTVSDDVEFTATYTELPKYTITFYVNGDQDENITISNIVAGNSTALPTSSNLTPAGFEISGWALENTTTAVADPYTPSANVALYALLQLENMPTSEYYAKVTEDLTDWSGEYLIVYEDGNLAFDGSLETLDGASNTIAITITNNTIGATTTIDSSRFTIEAYNTGYSIKSASNKYIGNDSDSNALTASDTQLENSISYNDTDNEITIISSGGAYLRYNSASNQARFRYYKSSSYSNQKAIQLYKKVSETPAAFNNVIVLEESQQMADNIPANTCVVVEDGAILTFTGANNGTAANLIIKDGGQLKVYASGAKDGGVQATVEKNINAVSNWAEQNPDGWYFIASPINVNNLNPEVVDNLITDDDEDNSHTFDLYKYVADNMDNEGLKPWYNYRAHSGDFVLANGQGYLYANANDQTLAFAGAVKPYSEENNANQVAVNAGWNLIGNPYTFNTYVNQSYYKLNNDRTAIEAVNNNAAIAPCTGIIVKAENSGNVTFSETNSGGSKGSVGIMLSKAGTRSNATLDNAIVSFNEGSQLEKFYFMQQNANLYIPQGKEEYAIVNAQAQGEMPVNFRANTNGQYTLTVNTENVEMNYLHLIDNMTGADIDLLQTPSYTFNAKTYDYESRFRLVFAANSDDNASAGSETFAFFANGSLIINNEGEATLQVIDMTGRVLRSEAINGSANIGTKGLATGVYVLRLVNGNNIKTQKMVMK